MNERIGPLFLPSISPQRPVGEIYEIELDMLETTCHAVDPTPLANCSVRQLAQHVSATLRVTVLACVCICGMGVCVCVCLMGERGRWEGCPSLACHDSA